MDVTTLPIAPIGATSILCIVVLLIIKGGLIPRSTYADRMADKDKQIEYLQAALQECQAQNKALMAVGHTAEKVLMSLHEATASDPGEDRHEVASS